MNLAAFSSLNVLIEVEEHKLILFKFIFLYQAQVSWTLLDPDVQYKKGICICLGTSMVAFGLNVDGKIKCLTMSEVKLSTSTEALLTYYLMGFFCFFLPFFVVLSGGSCCMVDHSHVHVVHILVLVN